jgi:dTMP kinase
MAADRAQHVAEVVVPALEAGGWVVTDRFSASTLAYQGYGRGMDLDQLGWLVDWATAGLRPDVNVLVDVPVAVGVERRAGAGHDRFEGLGEAFQQRVADGFRTMVAQDPAAWIVVDGTRSVDEVAAEVRAEVAARLGEPARG